MADRRPILVFGMLLAFALLAGMGARPPLVGGPAPAFSLKDLKGEAVNLSDFRGKVVLVNFWATWCEPCKKEMPEIQAAYEEHKNEGFVVLAINFGENLDQASSFSHHGNLGFPVLLDPRVKTASAYGVTNLPVSFFVDPDGFVQDRVFGGTLTRESIGEIFNRLAAKKEP